jgi:site-specific recombinase
LYAILSAAEPDAPFEARSGWLERLVRWLGRGAAPKPRDEQATPESPRAARLRLFVSVLEQVPAWRERVARLVGTVLRESSALHLLSRLGLPGDRSFLSEISDRFSRRFLPSPRDDRDLAQLLGRLLGRRRDSEFCAALDPQLSARLWRVLDDGMGFAPLKAAAGDAALLLATRISALGLSDDIRARSAPTPLRESPLFRLPRAADALLDQLASAGGAGSADAMRNAFRELQALCVACEETIAGVTLNLEQSGVSVDVVYRLEVISKSMQRLRALLDALVPCEPEQQAAAVDQLLARLIADRLRDHSTLDLARTSTHLLARKIIERAGQTGEHYITSTRTEYVKMLASAAGGGVLTAGTAMLKFTVVWGHFAPFVEGFLAATNYACSFLLMQALGLTLATKQPSMTAAALAASLREGEGRHQEDELDALVTTITRITRSQLAAAMGNIGLVIPAALALDRMCVIQTDEHFLDIESAEHVLSSLQLTHSGTLFYAALTGVLLWASSIAAGWFENWAVYRRLPEALAQHRISRLIGTRATAWLSGVFVRNVSGVGGNVALGVLLGITPVLGKFFGLPLDVRHVTLSTGALVFACATLGHEAVKLGAQGAAAGILAIGALNFGVSFVLALLVALRARQVNRSDRLRLLGAVISRLITHPREFVLPP